MSDAPQQPAGEAPPRAVRTRFGRLGELGGPFLGLAFVILVFSIIAEPQVRSQFLSLFNVKTVATQTVIVALGALGMTIVIVGGGIDLSIGSTVALASVVAAWVLQRDASWSWLAVAAGILTGGLVGLVNGSLITGLRMVPFIVTLGMLGVARGAAKWLARNQKIDAPLTWVADLMVKEPSVPWLERLAAGLREGAPAWLGPLPRWAADGLEFLRLAPGVWVVLVLAVAVALLLRRSVFGRHVVAVGSNEPTARLCGVRVERVKLWMYLLSGLLTGLAGVMQFARLTVGDPTVAVGLELDVIAAVVIGGGSLSGGEGSVVGSLVGALIMAFLRYGCTMVGWPTYRQEIIIGVIIVVAVAIDQLRHRVRP